MEEYIPRKEAIIAVCSARLPDVGKDGIPIANGKRSVSDCVRRIKAIPAADVRPVVLCRDCVNYVESDEANGEKMCVIDAEWCEEDGCYYGFNSYTEPDWFCAGGKKREET